MTVGLLTMCSLAMPEGGEASAQEFGNRIELLESIE